MRVFSCERKAPRAHLKLRELLPALLRWLVVAPLLVWRVTVLDPVTPVPVSAAAVRVMVLSPGAVVLLLLLLVAVPRHRTLLIVLERERETK